MSRSETEGPEGQGEGQDNEQSFDEWYQEQFDRAWAEDWVEEGPYSRDEDRQALYETERDAMEDVYGIEIPDEPSAVYAPDTAIGPEGAHEIVNALDGHQYAEFQRLEQQIEAEPENNTFEGDYIQADSGPEGEEGDDQESDAGEDAGDGSGWW
jgi:hypothetical protein